MNVSLRSCTGASGGFIQNMTVPPSDSSKYLRSAIARYALVEERYAPWSCATMDSAALPRCEARTICGVSPLFGQRMEYTCGSVGIVSGFDIPSSRSWIVVFHQTSTCPPALTA